MSERVSDEALDALVALVALVARGRVVALTGAGVSTESGIPDYRSPAALAKPRRPIQGPEFVRSAALRQRYWARAMVGWDRFRLAEPGQAHHALVKLETHGFVSGIITQNVDRLHRVAGSRHVVELHGALEEVNCLDCGVLVSRDDVQVRMQNDNPRWLDGPAPMAPDGDADLSDELVATFATPSCHACGGVLKPNVVFFGHNVAPEVALAAFNMVDDASALLIVGTSLAVYSGYRFLRRAAERQIPIAIVNRGPVRGEELATLKIEASTGQTLSRLADSVGQCPLAR